MGKGTENNRFRRFHFWNWSSVSIFWKCQLVCWVAFALVAIPIKRHLFGSFSGASVSLYRDGMGFLMTFALHEVYRRISFRRIRIAWILAIIITLSVGGGIFQTFLSQTIEHIPPFDRARLSDDTITIVVYYYRIALLFFWSLIYFVLRLIYEGRDTESRLADSVTNHRKTEIQMLRGQIIPHFLFNALNTILSALEDGKRGAPKMLQSLSDYLNYSLIHKNDDFVSLGEECDALMDYIAVKKARLRDDLSFACQIDPDTRTARVPGVCLQPLVENAIKYARETSVPPFIIRLHITREESTLLIEVCNTGRWITPEPYRASGGVGLENVRQRLNWLYPGQHTMEVIPEEGWVSVQIRIPCL